MTELDFDELDKAVGNLMKDVKSSDFMDDDDSDQIAVAEKPAPRDAVAEVDKPHAENKTAHVSSLPQPTRPVVSGGASISLASKRRGKFMDMVRTTSLPTDTPKTVKRQGVALQPISAALDEKKSDNSHHEDVDDSHLDAKPATSEDRGQKQPRKDTSYLDTTNFAMEHEATFDEPETASEEPEADKPAKIASAHPRKVDTSSDIDKIDDKPHKPVEPEIEPLASDEPDERKESDEPELEKPLTSPFLTGTRVEKRPLGGSSLSESDESDTEPEKDTETFESFTPDTPTIPEELSSEIMRIESSEANTGAQPASETEAPHKKASNPAVEPKKSETIPEPNVEVGSESDKQPKPVDTPAGGSIPPQYPEKPLTSSSEQENVAIYDTASYHQPLAHPAKRKSGLAVVLWILLIAIIGVGLGVAAFYLTVVRA